MKTQYVAYVTFQCNCETAFVDIAITLTQVYMRRLGCKEVMYNPCMEFVSSSIDTVCNQDGLKVDCMF